MISFKDIQEGILGKIDDTISKSDSNVKTLAFLDDLQKKAKTLNKWYSEFGLQPDKHGYDCMRRKLEVGDLVITLEQMHSGVLSDVLYGIVCGFENNPARTLIVQGLAKDLQNFNESDPFSKFIMYYAKPKEICLIAKAKEAEKMIKYIDTL